MDDRHERPNTPHAGSTTNHTSLPTDAAQVTIPGYGKAGLQAYLSRVEVYPKEIYPKADQWVLAHKHTPERLQFFWLTSHQTAPRGHKPGEGTPCRGGKSGVEFRQSPCQAPGCSRATKWVGRRKTGSGTRATCDQNGRTYGCFRARAIVEIEGGVRRICPPVGLDLHGQTQRHRPAYPSAVSPDGSRRPSDLPPRASSNREPQA